MCPENSIITIEEFRAYSDKFLSCLRNNVIFIHPTDTIYGIGCDARNQELVEKVSLLKNRHGREGRHGSFSIIAPSKQWIYENFDIDSNREEVLQWIDRLPGPYTLILKLRNSKAVCTGVKHKDGTVGVRIPDHWFSKVVEKLGFPIITTSANLKGEDFMTNIDDLHPEIRAAMNLIIYEGEKQGRPSTLINLHKGLIEVMPR